MRALCRPPPKSAARYGLARDLGLAAAHLCVRKHISAGGALDIITSARLLTGQGMRGCRLDDVGAAHDLFEMWSKIMQLCMLDDDYYRVRAAWLAGGSRCSRRRRG